MRRFGTAAAVLVLALGAAACSDSDGGGDDASSERGQEYVDAIAQAIGVAPGVPAERTECIAGAFVQGIGVDGLEDRGTPEDFADRNASVGDLTMDESQAEAAYEHLGTCSDPRELLVQSVVSSMDLSDEGDTCVDDAVDDDAARESFMMRFQGTDAQQPSEAMEETTAAVNQCLMAEMPAPPSQPGDSPPSQPGETEPSTAP